MYFKTIMVLAVVLLLYYVVMIVLDIMKQKAQDAAAEKTDTETDIDISEEASSFQPTYISRENPDGIQSATAVPASEEKTDESTSTPKEDGQQNNGGQSENTDTPQNPENIYHRPDYREATMTDGLLVEDLIEEVDRMAETGESDLGTVVHAWEGVD